MAEQAAGRAGLVPPAVFPLAVTVALARCLFMVSSQQSGATRCNSVCIRKLLTAVKTITERFSHALENLWRVALQVTLKKATATSHA